MKHILFLSYGKYSMARLIFALAKGYPLDEVVFADLYYLWKNYPEYFEELVKLEKDSPHTFKIAFTLPELAARFLAGYIPTRRKKGKSRATKN